MKAKTHGQGGGGTMEDKRCAEYGRWRGVGAGGTALQRHPRHNEFRRRKKRRLKISGAQPVQQLHRNYAHSAT